MFVVCIIGVVVYCVHLLGVLAMVIDPTKQKALVHHPGKEAAIAWSEQYQNVAFMRYGRYYTCTRSYVCDLINGGHPIKVLADHETD